MQSRGDLTPFFLFFSLAETLEAIKEVVKVSKSMEEIEKVI
jgi:hypothetical protein